jgi:RNA polymerase sigma factor (sigma-70 family)
MTADPDQLDVAAAMRGSVTAFERLYWRHAGRIRALARRMVGPATADDGVQDVFIRAWQKLPQFRGDAAFGTWLHRLAVNVLLRQLETARRADARFVGLDDVVMAAPARASDIDNALLSLPADQRAVVVLHDMEGYKHDEIAGMLGISVSASKMRLHRARTELRAYIGDPND